MKNKFSLFAGLLSLLTFIACNTQSSQKEEAVTASVADSASVTNNWKLGVQLWTFRLFSQEVALAKADSAGIKYVEAFLGQPVDNTSKDTFGINLSAGGRQKLKGLLQLHHIQMVAMGVTTPQNK